MLTPKHKGNEYHHGNLRQSALMAARHIVATKGIEGLGLRKVARLIGVSPAALYRHFSNLEALRYELSKTIRQELGEKMNAASSNFKTNRGPKGSATSKLIAIGDAYIEYAIENPRTFGIAFLNEDDSTTNDYTELSWMLLKNAVAELGELGFLEKSKLKDAPLVLWSLVHGCASLAASGSLSTREISVFKKSVLGGITEYLKTA